MAETQAAQPLLTMSGIVKVFPGVRALDGVDLDVRPGEVHALLGQNGAGKSTLIKVLTGVHQPDQGSVVYRGQPVTFARPLDAQAAGISTIYQEVNLVPLMSVARNLFLGREPTRLGLIDFPRMHRGASASLARYGIRVDVRRPLRELGLGVQQMVAIARAIDADHRVVIMDEPTSHLDQQTEGMVQRSLRALPQGTTLFLVTHSPSLLEAVDRLIVMEKGRVLLDGAKADVLGQLRSVVEKRRENALPAAVQAAKGPA